MKERRVRLGEGGGERWEGVVSGWSTCENARAHIVVVFCSNRHKYTVAGSEQAVDGRCLSLQRRRIICLCVFVCMHVLGVRRGLFGCRYFCNNIRTRVWFSYLYENICARVRPCPNA